jgi:hypothetical protein
MEQTIQQGLAHWRNNPGLDPVREAQEINRLPDNERTAWQARWRDVDELQSRVTKKDERTKCRKEPDTPKAKPEDCSLPQPGATGR